MTYLFIGAGQAGSAIVDEIFEYEESSRFSLFGGTDIGTVGTPLAFNSTVRDLRNLSNIPQRNQYGVSAQEGLVEGTALGFEEQVTGGFGRNPVEADEVMQNYELELEGQLSDRFFREDSEGIQFAFVFLGLGGGTGCGIAPYIVNAIQDLTDDTVGVIVGGILPNTTGPMTTDDDDDDEISAGRQAWNTMYGLDRIEDRADGIVLIDNQRISYETVVESDFNKYNEYIAAAVYDLIAGPVISDVDESEADPDTPTIDVQDVVTSLSFGTGVDTDSRAGYGSIGRAVKMTKSLRGYLMPFIGYQDADGAALSRIAASKQTLADADPGDAEKAIVSIRAPERYLENDKYKIETSAVEGFFRGHHSIPEFNMGVTVSDRNLASVTALLTYEKSELDRLDDIRKTANNYEEARTWSESV